MLPQTTLTAFALHQVIIIAYQGLFLLIAMKSWYLRRLRQSPRSVFACLCIESSFCSSLINSFTFSPLNMLRRKNSTGPLKRHPPPSFFMVTSDMPLFLHVRQNSAHYGVCISRCSLDPTLKSKMVKMYVDIFQKCKSFLDTKLLFFTSAEFNLI